MKSIWKYEFPPGGRVELLMPFGARVLHVGTQRRGDLCLWALVDPGALQSKRVFRVFGTGHPIEPGVGFEYVGTVVLVEYGFVWHVFEIIE